MRWSLYHCWRTHLRMFGCLSLFMSCISLSMELLFERCLFIFNTSTRPDALCTTCKEGSRGFIQLDWLVQYLSDIVTYGPMEVSFKWVPGFVDHIGNNIYEIQLSIYLAEQSSGSEEAERQPLISVIIISPICTHLSLFPEIGQRRGKGLDLMLKLRLWFRFKEMVPLCCFQVTNTNGKS